MNKPSEQEGASAGQQRAPANDRGARETDTDSGQRSADAAPAEGSDPAPKLEAPTHAPSGGEVFTPPGEAPALKIEEPAPFCEVPVVSPAQQAPTKTPLFVANQGLRYHRQTMIRAIEKQTGRVLLCFIGGAEAQIHRDDTGPFVDLLHNVHAGYRVDLMIHTVGGDIDMAEKLIRMVQARVGEDGDIRVIVPEFAKSAGTLMALGANSILMSSDVSELGAIDPQFHLKDGLGNEICHSVLRYLASFEEHAVALRASPTDPVAALMLDKFDPIVVHKFKGIRDRARVLAENLLIPRGKLYSSISAELMNIDRWKSHNQMISAQDAKSIGLDVEIVSGEDSLWQEMWLLMSFLRLAVERRQKIFESNYVSLVV
ncbi:MAG: SDH family Clp fold serine proteinase [Vitreimonas sp.]